MIKIKLLYDWQPEVNPGWTAGAIVRTSRKIAKRLVLAEIAEWVW